MQLKLHLVTEGLAEDVLVDVDPHASVGELALALFPARRSAGQGDLGLVVDVDSPGRRVVPPATRVDRSGLLSGCSVGPSSARLASPPPASVGTVVVHEGPDAPARWPLRAGVSTIGRGRDRDLRLSDLLVSRRHAELVVDDTVEIRDTASANGLSMSGLAVERAVLHPGDRVTLGATTISAALDEHRRGHRARCANEIGFNRSPRVDPRHEGVVLVAPEPPQAPAPQRFPIATTVAPILMAGLIYAITQNVLTILFVVLGPMMMLGSWWETRSVTRRQIATATAHFRSSLADLAIQLAYAHELERAGRRTEHPSVVEVIEAVEQRTPLVWTRRTEHDSFCQVRLGLGTQPSRNTVEMPSSNTTLPGLWRELTETVARFTHVSGVPVVADVRVSGNLGIAGPEVASELVVRGVVAQFVGLHSPADLRVFALAPDDRWEWLKWLPHANPRCLAANSAESLALMARIEAMIDHRSVGRESPGASTGGTVDLVVVHDTAPFDRSRLVQIAERGPDVGVHVVWVAPSVERLPAVCRTFVDLDANTGRGRAGFVQDRGDVHDLVLEPVGAAMASRFGRMLSPLVDIGARVDTSSELPASVAFVDLAGHDLALSADAVVDRWRANGSLPSTLRHPRRRDHGLPALIGQTTDGPIHLDLRVQGPHALVAGTTGSGKSEFLQSWVLGMAVDQSPARVTFLFVDYKGGAAFADCVDLPHCVGLVTDLSPHLVRRALASLDAELRFRERLLGEKRAKDLVDLERRNDPDCPPSLVIVVDEFAALVAEMPEFVDGVVNIAQRGRSLGLHLILATQRPAGVIGGNLRANTNLRIALRMADEQDSDDVIGTRRAAMFDPDVPGRAVVKAGPGRITEFQAAYSGGHRAGRARPPRIDVSTLRFGRPTRRAVHQEPESHPSHPVGASDLERVVRTVGDAARRLEIPAPRRPWLPELAPRYRLESLPTERSDGSIPFGVADDPHAQLQTAVAFRPDIDGNMIVYGTGGSGKSGFLRAVGFAAGLGSGRSEPVWVYGLDFASRGLRPLAPLPHVGSLIVGDDGERVQRLLRMLESTLDERALRYARAEASTISDYRRLTGALDEARILVLIDGVGAFRSEYDGGASSRSWDLLLTIAAEGRALGVHLVMSAERPAAVPSALAASIQRTLVLRLANDLEYAVVDVPADAFGPNTPPGRGFLDGREVQVAVVGGESDLSRQRVAIERCTDAIADRELLRPPPVESLPKRVALGDLTVETDRPILGVRDDTLTAIDFEPSGVFLVAGGPRSGTSTTVATMVRSLATVRPQTEFVLLGQRRSPLSSIVSWAAFAEGVTAVERLAAGLTDGLVGAGDGPVAIAIEAVGELLDTDADLPLQGLLRACRDRGVFVIAEGEISSLGGSWPLLQAIKSHRTGIVLQPDQIDGEALFRTPFPRLTRAEFPAGRGLMVQGGQVCKVQVALPE